MTSSQRIPWIDIAKGLSIVLVVLGHSGDFFGNHYLAWFRMPLFFFLSGMVFKPIQYHHFKRWVTKKTINMMIPYFSYGTVIIFIFSYPDFHNLLDRSMILFYGGMKLTGEHGVFWFITCPLLTQITFGLLSAFSVKTQIICLSGFYIVAHLISNSALKSIAVPWNADVVFLTLTYYAIGYYCKQIIIDNVNNIKLFLIPFILALFFILLDSTNILIFNLDLKYKNYHNIILDVLVPVSFILPICVISYYISRAKSLQSLAWLGKNTITIMYLHIPVNLILQKTINFEYGFIYYTLIGIILPLIFGVIFSRSSILSTVFLSKNEKQLSTTAL